MLLILGRTIQLGRLAQALALGLVVLCGALLIACADGQDTPTTQGATPTATAAVAPTNPQPTQEPTRPEPTPTGSSTAGPSQSDSPVKVVTSTNFVGDWARIVGGDRAEVFAMLPPGQDPHSFSPGGRDVAKVADADVVFTIGLSLESEWLYDLLRNASADESKLIALGEFVDPIESTGPDPHGHGGDDHGETMAADGHGESAVMGRLLVADAVEAHLSVIDLSTDDVDSGIFEVAAPGATVYSSPTHRYGIVLARGPEDDDDRIHVFDGGVFLVEHGDHYDLVTQPVSRHALEIVEEWPVHSVNSHGWTTIFADTNGHVILINEEDLANSRGIYEPIVLEAGIQHGTAFVISDDHVIMSSNNPVCTEFIPSQDCLPLGVEVRTFDDEVVYGAANRSCTGVHGEAHNARGAVFGCWVGGVLSVHAHDGQYEHELIPYPLDQAEELKLGLFYGHHRSDNFFAPATLFIDGQFSQGGVWLVDTENSEMREVFPEPSVSAAFSGDGETFYILDYSGVLHVLDAHDGELIETMELVEPADPVFGAPTAAMSVVGEMLYVSDPNTGHVKAVHLDEMEIEEEWEVGSAPSSLAFLGVADSSGAPGEGHDEHGEDEHDHGPLDPHFWFDPIRVKIAVNEIAAQLSALDPEGATVYQRNAADYGQQLDELHAWILEQVDLVAPERRQLVTSHDTFAYFAKAYEFEVVGLVIPSLGPDLEPSGEHLAEVIEVVREHGVPAVFGETTVSERLAQAVARETGADLVQLYSGSMGAEGSSGDTYLGMVRTNVERIVEALK